MPLPISIKGKRQICYSMSNLFNMMVFCARFQIIQSAFGELTWSTIKKTS